MISNNGLFPTAQGDVHLATNGGSEDALVAKLSSSGKFVLVKAAGGIGTGDEGTGIALDKDGHLYVTGTVGCPGKFDQTTLNAPPGQETTREFIWKMSPWSANPDS